MSWQPDPAAFLADLEAKPDRLRALAGRLGDDPWPVDPMPRRVALLGLGSSRFAALAGAAAMRARGIDAVAEYAGAKAAVPGGPGTLAVGISASGGTAETVAALQRHAAAGSATVALTEAADGSALGDAADALVGLTAGPEAGGVACRSYLHTIVRLLQLEAQLAGDPPALVADAARRAADAADDLLARRAGWLSEVAEHVGGGPAFLIAPAERLANAEQGALMLREGPRLHATACESADWLHVDVYLTKPLADRYRALVFAGSAADSQIEAWLRERGSPWIAVGASVGGHAVRYEGDDDERTRLLTEVLVPEIAAAALWRRV
jgi:fructoselysine-6-P-deglycase FrlB-like protein